MDIIYLESKIDDIGTRLDVFIASNLNNYSRTYIKNIIDKKMVQVNGIIKKSNYRLKQNDNVRVSIPKAVGLDFEAEKIPLDIIYEDDHLLIINKPQGMVVHPAHGNYSGTLVNALLGYCVSLSEINGVLRPGIVHRLDKDTSGIIMVAKTNKAHLNLSYQLQNRSISRKYIALLEGRISKDIWTVDAPIGRNPKDRKKMTVIQKNSKEAITYFKVLERFNSYTLVGAQLETGRTHQIRVHSKYFGHPLVGDPVYGFKKQGFNLKGQLLHAIKIEFLHPEYGDMMKFIAPIPSHFQETLDILRLKTANKDIDDTV